MKFKVGDRVKVIETNVENTKKYRGYGVVKKIFDNGKGYPYLVKFNNFNLQLWSEVEGHMSKYDELKERIEEWFDKACNLGGGWDKEADDILQEIYRNSNNTYYALAIGVRDSGGEQNIDILLGTSRINQKTFYYNSQCQKLSALKQTFVWLLDHSDIKKDDKSELKAKLALLEEQLREIKKEL